MDAGGEFRFSTVVDILQQHGTGYGDLDLEFRKTENEASKRYEATRWLRKMVGVVGAKDLPAEPTEEEFTVALRSGIILCNAVNKIQPGAVLKVVESSCHSVHIQDGAPLTAFQYFENVRNFLVAALELGLPTFEASDLEQGGNPSRVVSCVLALKSYAEWKKHGGNGVWKFGGNLKQAPTHINIPDLKMLVREVLFDRKTEEVPAMVESMLSKVVEHFNHQIQGQSEQIKTSKELAISHGSTSFTIHGLDDRKEETKFNPHEEVKAQVLNQKHIFDCHQKDLQKLKCSLHSTKISVQIMQRKLHEELYNLSMHIRSLADATSNYNNVLEENRKLYNQVQDLKGSIRVYCRVRPSLTRESKYLSTVNRIEEGYINIYTPYGYGNGHRSFNFNKVFGPSATQEDVFSDTKPLIRSVLDGYNVCIFAYGQTGSGKTFTMTGPKDLTSQTQGVNYRSLRDLFLLSEQRKNAFRYEVSVQMIEIYNEQIRDLLATDGFNKKLEIHNNSQTGSNIPDAKVISVSSTSDIINLMNFGESNRAFGATTLNDHSSRSHSCLTVLVEGTELSCGTILRGCLHLVDLAGSERVKKSEAMGKRLKEAQYINKSLSALGDVISSLAQKNPHVPYRNSKLTQLLQSSLGGHAKTLMFVHISPEPDFLEETIGTLRFAERVSKVELGAAKENKESMHVKELNEQIAFLKARLIEETAQIQHASGSAEVQNTFVLRQSSDATDDLLPCNPNEQEFIENTDKESGSGEWVEEQQVMVNKLEDESYNNTLDDLDILTTDSSEPDLHCQFNHHIKPPNGNTKQSPLKPPLKGQEFSKAGASSFTKRPIAVRRNGGVRVSIDGKQKSVNKK